MHYPDKDTPIEGETDCVHPLVYFEESELDETVYSDTAIGRSIDELILKQSRNDDERELLEMKIGELSA